MTCDFIVDVTDVSPPPDQNTHQSRNKSGWRLPPRPRPPASLFPSLLRHGAKEAAKVSRWAAASLQQKSLSLAVRGAAAVAENLQVRTSADGRKWQFMILSRVQAELSPVCQQQPCAECTDTALLTALLLNKQELEKHKYSLMARVSAAAKMSKSPPSAASFVCRQSGSVVSCHVRTLKVSTKLCCCGKKKNISKNMQTLSQLFLHQYTPNFLTLVEICLRIMDITKWGHYRPGLKTCTFLHINNQARWQFYNKNKRRTLAGPS